MTFDLEAQHTAGPTAKLSLPTPWEHQERAHVELRGKFVGGHRRIMLCSPTGSGKTAMALRVVAEAIMRGRRALFVCDRTALINQTSARADEYGLDHGVVQAEHWRRNTRLPFQIASIQTISKREYWPEADVIVVDEAHTTYSAVKELCARTTATVIGLTATPCTKGLGLLYTTVVNASTMDELTRKGVLVPLRVFTCVTPDMAGAATNSNGEWTIKAASDRELKIVGDVVAEWQKYGEDRKTIAFGADIAYCEQLVQRFNAAGICADTFTNETDDNTRAALLAEFSKPDSAIKILVSVDCLAKGFDVKDIGCVIDARPMRKSLSTVIQMWGRGLRSCPEYGKVDCILLDFSGNIRRFHDDYVDVFFNGFGSLDVAEKLDAHPREEGEDFVPGGCPKCSHKPFRRRCLACGYQKVSEALVEEAPGEMQEVRIGKSVLASNKEELWNQLCSYAREHVRSEKKAGWVWYKYQDIIGEKPPRSFSYETAPDVPVSSATINKLKQLHIRFRKSAARRAETA